MIVYRFELDFMKRIANGQELSSKNDLSVLMFVCCLLSKTVPDEMRQCHKYDDLDAETRIAIANTAAFWDLEGHS